MTKNKKQTLKKNLNQKHKLSHKMMIIGWYMHTHTEAAQGGEMTLNKKTLPLLSNQKGFEQYATLQFVFCPK